MKIIIYLIGWALLGFSLANADLNVADWKYWVAIAAASFIAAFSPWGGSK